MDCCAHCFEDRFLTRQIVEHAEGHDGDCHFCGSTNVRLLDASLLREYFEPLVGAYIDNSTGQPIVEQLKSDWCLFGNMADAAATALLAAILDAADIADRRILPLLPDSGDPIERWHQFREELKFQNRFFPRVTVDLDRLGELLNFLVIELQVPQPPMFRARVSEDGCIYEPAAMGPPPHELSTHGRANPAGIPYLYLASDVDTAIAETRPHPGEQVCVAEFTLSASVKLADLRDPRRTISPFSLGDEQEISLLRKDMGLLCQLGEELTRAVVPRVAHLEYLPSQYLCEFIKYRGFDGVVYRSSAASGSNFAFFNPAIALAGTVKLFRVTHIDVSAEEEW
jgi:hypothetical protein